MSTKPDNGGMKHVGLSLEAALHGRVKAAAALVEMGLEDYIIFKLQQDTSDLIEAQHKRKASLPDPESEDEQQSKKKMKPLK